MIDFSKGCAGGAPEQAETEVFSNENAAALIRFVQEAWVKSRESFSRSQDLEAGGSLEIKGLTKSD
ncbi:MAG: hypothetical protein HC888_16185 [Candidatus Competibacteraceae bacterium]|nr:hypothetical protein [Candidatus Competibacteraceae bacterium]